MIQVNLEKLKVNLKKIQVDMKGFRLIEKIQID